MWKFAQGKVPVLQKTSGSFSLPVPTGGINARDAYTDMDPHDAVGMTNVFPEANYVAVRAGYNSWATGMTNPVQTLLVWNGLTGLDKIFAAAGSVIYDVNASGAATSVVTGLTNAKWQWTNLQNAGGMFLVLCNGANSVRNYNGTTWTTPAITGVTSSTLINVCQFKERLWFAQKDTLDLWYLGLQSISGAATKYPMGSVFRRGGYVIAIGSFSNDAGEGPDDYFAIATNNGEVAVYQGTDPTSATTWSLSGLFDLGKPIGRRCMARMNGDLAIITQDGIISMQAALRFDRSAGQKAAITAKIQTLFSQYSQQYYTNFGWQPCVFPKNRYLIVNIPAVSDMVQSQLVMNTVTGSWCQFTGMAAGCWAVANDKLYFGGNSGVVYQASNGYLDNFGTIPFSLQTAWQKVSGDTNKFFTMVRPVMLSGGSAVFGIAANVDFYTVNPSPGTSGPQISGMSWPFTWPGTWGGQNVLDAQWQSVGAIGTWVSINLAGTINGAALQVNNFELIAQKGGPL
ncbi:hypothetical protein UFOVP833_55 [uncultured Caudovirales phage]|uniref:Uncharacterized protein n=1 Tax=uncultured Caudovirales phage TaxID=2100421 RepID=A0A6J5P280_9CAUD|nr:hypothetical protein UFOVP833_55 [uncultured Caudovirales phage]CAB4218448.1 hypothetical protein UFOVP1603_33 [uncultured Caudovirales phage]